MKPKAIRFLAGVARAISYILVFYAGLAIGAKGALAGIVPIFAILGAIIFGVIANATRELATLYEKLM